MHADKEQVVEAINTAVHSWLEENGFDEDELNQYDLWSTFVDDGSLSGDSFDNGLAFADQKALLAFRYLEGGEYPDYESYFMTIIDALIPYVSQDVIDMVDGFFQ